MLKQTIAVVAAFAMAAAAREKTPPKVYENTRELARSCADVWPKIIPATSKRGFMPDTSDRAGGLMKLRYTRGNTGYLKSDKDVKALTTTRIGVLTTFDAFRIIGAAVSLVDNGTVCQATVQVQYEGWINSIARKGWVALESNGALESAVLDDIDAATR